MIYREYTLPCGCLAQVQNGLQTFISICWHNTIFTWWILLNIYKTRWIDSTPTSEVTQSGGPYPAGPYTSPWSPKGHTVMNDCLHLFCSMSISPPTTEIRLLIFQNYIWPWKFKAMAKVNPIGHIWELEFNRYVCFFVSWQSYHFWQRNSKSIHQSHQSCQNWKKSEKLFRSYRVHKFLCLAAMETAYEPLKKIKSPPVYRSDLRMNIDTVVSLLELRSAQH